ncbi:MAG: glycosyltransferase family 4 protein [Deltaproteobacteria bacterium]
MKRTEGFYRADEYKLIKFNTMKILLVNDYGVPLGGAEVYILRLRKLLRDKGHDARLFTSNVAADGQVNEADYTCVGTTSPFRAALQTMNPWAYLKLGKVIKEFKPDVVHVKIFLTQLSPLILPLLRDIPSIYHVAWYRPICPTGTKLLPDGNLCNVKPGITCRQNKCLPSGDWAALMLQLKLFRRWRGAFNTILANSESVRDKLVSYGIDNAEVLDYCIPESGTDVHLSETPTVAFAGRLVREKGADILLRAFANVLKFIPAARLLIAGEGTESEKLRGLISDLNMSPNVSMLGSIPSSHLDSHLSEAWVQAVPSVWEEPFGMAAAEAMMRGTAVIASDTGGLREIIDNGKSGLLVPPGDVEELTVKLTRLLGDKSLAQSIGRAGHMSASSRFSADKHLEKLMIIYESLCARHS